MHDVLNESQGNKAVCCSIFCGFQKKLPKKRKEKVTAQEHSLQKTKYDCHKVTKRCVAAFFFGFQKNAAKKTRKKTCPHKNISYKVLYMIICTNC